MPRARTAGRPSSPPAPAPARDARLDLILALVAAAVVAVVFHRATGYFFRADDFEGLARARGLLPERTGLARLIPWRLYFEVFERAFGLAPLAYHLASLAALGAAAALAFAWLRPVAGRWAALLGAAFYASHPAHYASAYWISAIGDPLAAAFALATLLAARGAQPWRWAAVPAFALALVSKESALLVPLVAFLDPGRSPALARARRDPLAWTLVAMAAAMAAYYVIADPIGTRDAGGQAYVPRPGEHVVANLLTYAGWTVNFLLPTMRSMSDAVEPAAFAPGLAALALWLVGLTWRPLRRAGWLAGGVLWLAMLAPVLPLEQRTFRYYLSGPLAGAALVLAAAFAAATGSAGGRAARAGVAALAAVALAALLAANGAALVNKIEFSPFRLPGSRADAIVDRALIAGRIRDGLRATPPPAGVALRFWSPASRRLAGVPDSVAAFGYWERNVSDAVLGGLGVRVMFPELGAVEFVPNFVPGGDSLWYAVYQPDGTLRAGPASEIGRALEQLRSR